MAPTLCKNIFINGTLYDIEVSLVMVVFFRVFFVMVVFVIAHCRNIHNIAAHGVTAAEALISTSAVVQESSPEDKWCYSLFQSKEWLSWCSISWL